VTVERLTETPASVTFCGPLGFTVTPTETVFAAVAVTVALTAEAGLDVLIVKFAESWPAGMNTELGQLTAGLLLESVILAPPVGAGTASMTVPVVEAPPVSVLRAAVTCNTSGACKVSVALTGPHGATLVAVTEAPMKLISAFTERLMGADVCPAATVTVPRVFPLATSCTGYPPAGAGLPRVRVPLKVPLPGIGRAIDASSVSPVTQGGLTWRVAVIVFDDVALMVTDTPVATAFVVTLKVADVCPAGIETVGGTLTPPVLADIVTFTPAAPAGPVRVTVPVEEPPPVVDVGLSVTLPIVP
jgi:hypothetical protein